jgi:hypothetical protein
VEYGGRPIVQCAFGNLRLPSEEDSSEADLLIDLTITNLWTDYFSQWPGLVQTIHAGGKFQVITPYWQDGFRDVYIPPGETVTVEALPLYFYNDSNAPGKKVILDPNPKLELYQST